MTLSRNSDRDFSILRNSYDSHFFRNHELLWFAKRTRLRKRASRDALV